MVDHYEGSRSPVKILYQMLQLLHHLSLLSDEGSAGGALKAFNRKVKDLDNFIRPALPNLAVFNAIHEVNKAWATNVTQALITHYKTELDFLKGQLFGWKVSAADRVLYRNKAHQWARRNFGRKIQNSTFEELDKILNSFCGPSVKTSKTNLNASKDPKPTTEVPATRRPAASDQVGTTVPPSTPSKRRRRSSSCDEHQPKRSCTPRKLLQNLVPEQPAPQTSPRASSYAAAARSPPSGHFETRAHQKKPNSTPSVRRFPKIGREDKTGQNIHKHWFIPKITKPILILGTSNLSRIEQVRRTDVQVVSYPGLQLSHLLKILMAYSPNPRDPGMKPTKIVISAGINDRGFAPTTNETNMKKVVNRLRDLFPESKIFIAQHRYSDKLTTSEKNTLDKLNENIVLTCSNKSNVDFIPPIPRSAFQIGPNDHIHWTATCANFTCHHYLRHLN